MTPRSVPTDPEIQAQIDQEEAALERLRSADAGPFLQEAGVRWDVTTTAIDDRWREINSKALDRVLESIRDITARMIGGLRGDAEDWLAQDVADELLVEIKQRSIDYAARVLAVRASRS